MGKTLASNDTPQNTSSCNCINNKKLIEITDKYTPRCFSFLYVKKQTFENHIYFFFIRVQIYIRLSHGIPIGGWGLWLWHHEMGKRPTAIKLLFNHAKEWENVNYICKNNKKRSSLTWVGGGQDVLLLTWVWPSCSVHKRRGTKLYNRPTRRVVNNNNGIPNSPYRSFRTPREPLSPDAVSGALVA